MFTDEQIKIQQKERYLSCWSWNPEFDKDGYIVVKNFADVKKITPPENPVVGIKEYFKFTNSFEFRNEDQVPGSSSRIRYPSYRELYYESLKKAENILGRKLLPTYYFDRIYYPSQQLHKHLDRDSCEVSVSIHLSTNLKKDWPFNLETRTWYTNKKMKDLWKIGEKVSICLNPGDAIIYMGCEIPHWRDPLPSRYNKLIRFFKEDDTYYHQLFFHYVFADGDRAHCFQPV